MSLKEDLDAAVEAPAAENAGVRRKLVRVAAALLVDARRVDARTLDISASGASVVSETAVPVGSRVSIVLAAHPAGSFIRIRAAVACCVLSKAAGFRISLLFRELDSGTAAALAEWIRRPPRA